MAGRGHYRRRARGTSAGPPTTLSYSPSSRPNEATFQRPTPSSSAAAAATTWSTSAPKADRRAAPARGAGAARTSARSPAAGSGSRRRCCQPRPGTSRRADASASLAAAPVQTDVRRRGLGEVAENGPAQTPSRSKRAAASAGSSRYDHSTIAGQAAMPLGPAKARPDQHVRALAQSRRGSPRAASSWCAPPRAPARAAPVELAAEPTTASGWPSGTDRPRPARGRETAAPRRSRASAVPGAAAPSGPSTTSDSPGRSSGDRLVASTRGDSQDASSAAMASAAVAVTCSQLSTTHQSGLLGRRVDQRVEGRETQLRGDRTGDVLRGRSRPSGRRRGHPTRSRRSRGAEPTSRGRSCRSRPGR